MLDWGKRFSNLQGGKGGGVCAYEKMFINMEAKRKILMLVWSWDVCHLHLKSGSGFI